MRIEILVVLIVFLGTSLAIDLSKERMVSCQRTICENPLGRCETQAAEIRESEIEAFMKPGVFVMSAKCGG